MMSQPLLTAEALRELDEANEPVHPLQRMDPTAGSVPIPRARRRCVPYCIEIVQRVVQATFSERVYAACAVVWVALCIVGLVSCVNSFKQPLIASSLVTKDSVAAPDALVLVCSVNLGVDIEYCESEVVVAITRVLDIQKQKGQLLCASDPKYRKKLPYYTAMEKGLYTCQILDVSQMIRDGCVPPTIASEQGGVHIVLQVRATNTTALLPDPELYGYFVSASNEHVTYGPSAAKGRFANTLLRHVDRKEFAANFLSTPFQLWHTSSQFTNFYTFTGQDIYPNCSRLIFSLTTDQLSAPEKFVVEQQTDDVSFGLLSLLGFVGGTHGLLRLIAQAIIWCRYRNSPRTRQTQQPHDPVAKETELGTVPASPFDTLSRRQVSTHPPSLT